MTSRAWGRWAPVICIAPPVVILLLRGDFTDAFQWIAIAGLWLVVTEDFR